MSTKREKQAIASAKIRLLTEENKTRAKKRPRKQIIAIGLSEAGLSRKNKKNG